jgi:hypothetical protein
MLFDLYQQSKIRTVESAVDDAFAKAHSAEASVDQVAARLGRLALVSQALWELLRDRHGVSEEELKAKILEVDLRDGSKDGAIGTTVLSCPSCGNRTNSKRPMCIICGVPVPSKHVFEA